MGLSPDVGLATGVWVEALLYGIYACLFFEALYIMVNKRAPSVNSAKVFLAGISAMFLLSTAHMVVNLYRFIRGFVLRIDPNGPYSYYFDFGRWDTVAHSAMLCMMTWLGDGLVIYRCYVIWDKKIWVTILPMLLLIMSITSNTVLLFWFTHPGSQTDGVVLQWMATVYPFAFAQNTITTGMIAFKIWRQHRASTIIGVSSNSPLNLLGVVRIIVESAMIYTFQLLILIILFPLRHNAQFIVQSAVIPSMGIVFVLIAVRVQFSRSRAFFGDTVMASMPPWMNDDSSTRDECNDPEQQRSSQHPADFQGVDAPSIIQEKREKEFNVTIRPLKGKVRCPGQTTSAPN